MTTPQWASDIAIDATLAAELIGAQFPELPLDRIAPLGEGWDNAAFVVDERLAFRFPRRRIAAALIKREISLLPLIAPHVPLAVPAPTYVGAPTHAYPWYFAGYPLIAGTTACKLELSDEQRTAAAQPLGAFLRALHAVDPRPLSEHGLPPDEIGRLDPAKRLELTRKRVAVLQSLNYPVDGAIAAAVAWLTDHPAQPATDGERRVVHGDLYARHVLFDPDNRIAGIIDWGDVHAGDPALDLSLAHLLLPESAHAAFRAAYGEIGERMWNAARYRALYHAILEIEYGVRVDDAPMRAAGIAALRLMRAG